MSFKLQPEIFKEVGFDKKRLEVFKKTRKINTIMDLYENQLTELFEILYSPKSKDVKAKKQFAKDCLTSTNKHKGVWVYLPWQETLIHTLSEDDYYQLRTNRNRDLITEAEQKKLKSFTAGIAGLSIGSNMAEVLVHLGIVNIKISDFDELATSNLNRVAFGLPQIGSNKATLTAHKLYEIDPFIKLQVFETGLNKNNLVSFLAGTKKLNTVIDAIDDFEIKIRLRLEAKKLRVPVLMFTNLGDSCLVDIERYDQEKNLEIFNGLLGNLPEKILKSKITKQDKQKLAAKLVGIENIPTKALASLPQIGKTLAGRPQLISTVSVSSGLGGFIVRKIALNEPCPSGRYLVQFDSAIFSQKKIPDPYSKEPGRDKIISKLAQ